MMTEPENKCRVLVVDDEEPILRLLGEMLGAIGHEPITCATLEQAYQLYLERAPQIILLDVNMGAESGFTLLKRLRFTIPTCSVIVMSGDMRPDYPVEAIRHGASGYLIKPFTLKSLQGEIDRVLAWQGETLKRLEDKSRLQEELESRTRELLHETGMGLAVQRGLIMALCRLAEFRDHETGTHLHRMAEYSRVIGTALARHPRYAGRIDRLFLRRLHATAPLHDIGKAGIPDEILLKKGPLTDDERRVMMRHPLIGKATLEAVSHELGDDHRGQVHMGMDICEYHHERWDGTGYPHGLAGEQIPLAARIVALADFYDALSSPRVYRPVALDHDEVVAMVRSQSGRHFDPDVVEAFFAAEAEIRAIREGQHPEPPAGQ